uniref:Cytochrome P450 CYP4C1-like protein transcript variant 3 n=1 Tax=Spodoptera frugiperda TaxID=7108 RepID=A0A5Q0TYP9_SPOFR|nr:cytochrome P450 CYP4C1-like protein transcript variant 3 [Spodoptera frugiperda]
MLLSVYILCTLLLCICVLLWSLERRERNKYRGVPTLPLLPFIGNIHQVIGDTQKLFHIVENITNICEEKQSLFVVWLGPCPILAVQHPDDVKMVTNSFVEKPYFYDFGRAWLGDGLVTAPGYIWKQSIKKLAGTFTSSVVDGYQDVFNAQAEKLVVNLKTKVGKEPFDVMHSLAFATLETICQTALGVSNISENIVTEEYYDAFNRCLELMIYRGMNILLHPDAIYRLTPAHKEMMKCVTALHKVSDNVMKKLRAEQKNVNISEMTGNHNQDTNRGPKFKAFLDILLELREVDPNLTDHQIKAEVDTIILAGQETVATAFFYALLMIGCKPGVQEKMYAELYSIFGNSKRPVSKEDLSRMSYCEAIINETLRLYPPAPGVMRYADRDLKLKSFTIPKGTICAINFWGAGRSVRAWGPDAKVYRPERWLEDELPGNPAAFLPFSYGRRACIGKKYAMAILKTMLAHCVRELVFESQADNLQLKIDLALRPVSGHLIQIRLREIENRCR